jgi:hypothetical protein
LICRHLKQPRGKQCRVYYCQIPISTIFRQIMDRYLTNFCKILPVGWVIFLSAQLATGLYRWQYVEEINYVDALKPSKLKRQITRMPHQLIFITRMPHNLYTNFSYATPLLEAIQRSLWGSFRALLSRICNTGDTGDAGGAGNAFASTVALAVAFAFALALALALALACSKKGVNSL